ncbi:MAG: phage tail protein [Planctomycetes bacterium]|nr:phage tail protein [Planctomycetota bacterium]
MGTGTRQDPYMGFSFQLAIEGITEGGFTEVTGLEATTQVEEVKEGGVNDYVHKLAKETTYGNLTLKRGLADSEALWKWHRNVVAGKIERKIIHIFMLKDYLDETAHQWSFKDAFPVKWSGPSFNAGSNTVAFESIEIAHHGFI